MWYDEMPLRLVVATICVISMGSDVFLRPGSAHRPLPHEEGTRQKNLSEVTEHRISFLTTGAESNSEVVDRRPPCDNVGYSACVKSSFGALTPRIMRITQAEHELRVDWQASSDIYASHSYHEIFIYNSKTSTQISRQIIPHGTCASMNVPVSADDPYGTELIAFTAVIGYSTSKRELLRFNVSRLLPPKPATVSLLSRNSYRIRFKVVHSHLTKGIIEIKSNASLRKLGRPLEAEAFDLKPFETITVSVRSCVTDGKSDILFCGTDSQITMTSNVARPSRVRDLKVHATDLRKYGISFRRPEFPRGRIDEYRLTWKALTSPFEEGKVVFETDGTMYFSGLDYFRAYKLSLAARNLDLQNEGTWHTGEYEHVIMPARPQIFWFELFRMAVRLLLLYLSFFTLDDFMLDVSLDLTLIAEHLNINNKQYLQTFRILMFVR